MAFASADAHPTAPRLLMLPMEMEEMKLRQHLDFAQDSFHPVDVVADVAVVVVVQSDDTAIAAFCPLPKRVHRMRMKTILRRMPGCHRDVSRVRHDGDLEKVAAVVDNVVVGKKEPKFLCSWRRRLCPRRATPTGECGPG